MKIEELKDIRCKSILTSGNICNRFLGRINGFYQLKCPRCKAIVTNLE